MKKILYVCVCAAVLFLGSCSSMAPSPEEKYDMPADFKYQEYADINRDVAMSQIYFNIIEENKVYKDTTVDKRDSTSKATSNCKNLLSDGDFARKIYLEYLFCDWFQSNENAPNKGACWNDGWEDFETFFQDSLLKYTGTPRYRVKSDTTIKMMCLFVPPAENVGDAEDYLKSFYYSSGDGNIAFGEKFNSELAIGHYFYTGRYDGRPYKKCNGQHGVEKNPDIHANKRGTYYDYGKYTFCLEEDKKIYVVQ